MIDEVIESVDIKDNLVIPQGPSRGLCLTGEELQYTNKFYPSLEETSSVRLDGEKLLIKLCQSTSIVKSLIYAIDIIDPALYKVKEILVINLKNPELGLKTLERIYSKHDVFLDIDKVIHIIQQN